MFIWQQPGWHRLYTVNLFLRPALVRVGSFRQTDRLSKSIWSSKTPRTALYIFSDLATSLKCSRCSSDSESPDFYWAFLSPRIHDFMNWWSSRVASSMYWSSSPIPGTKVNFCFASRQPGLVQAFNFNKGSWTLYFTGESNIKCSFETWVFVQVWVKPTAAFEVQVWFQFWGLIGATTGILTCRDLADTVPN